MDDKVMAIKVLGSPGQDPKYLKITRWKVKSKDITLILDRVH
jgi:hypothetical protein